MPRSSSSCLALPLFALASLAGCRPEPTTPSTVPAPAHPHSHAHGPAEMDGHHRPHDMPHRFEDAEAWAEHFDDPQRDAWQRPDTVIESLAIPPEAVVADVGAGTGYFTVRLARAVPSGRVIATDVEPDMVRYLGERAEREALTNVVAVQGTPEDPGLPEPVDLVLLCDVVHHIADRPAFFSAVAAKLRPGARVVIVDFKPDAPEGSPGPPARHRLSIDALERDLASAGLRLARADDDTLPYQYIAVFTSA